MNIANTASNSDDRTSSRLNSRKNRPSRWGTPTQSSEQQHQGQHCTTNTASIPLPSGPPITQKTPLEFIPISQSNVVRPSVTSPINLNNRSSALNTSPSTSFALNAFAPPLPSFGMNGNALNTQPAPVPQLGTLSVPQLPLSSPLFPSLLMPPSLGFGAVNDLLAAGLIGNATLTAPSVSSQAPPFVLSQVNNQSQDITQQLASFASSLQPLGTHPPRLTVTGVPPPPPATSNGKAEVDISISKPLAEKIRQIAEGAELCPLSEDTHDNSKKNEHKAGEEVKHNESGRKSASAEEEEGSDADAKVTTSKGPMFNQARKMLSTSLKKNFKKRLITKEEYKIIMKKGVTALSQRTRLNQAKVDDYANKYVQCIIHRRKKKR
uniref:SFR19-like C-terminal domain-containing protein n=1 Tax=Syphacia muris TaxID=451379 RepID=A0A0N5A8Q0_9BILA